MRRSGPVAPAAATVLVAAGATSHAVAGDGGSDRISAAGSADAGFARDMAVRHQQAVEMSYVVRDRADDEEVRRLACGIAQTQANQRGTMPGRLDLWELPRVSAEPPMAWPGMGDAAAGEDGAPMPGMATDAGTERLGTLDGRQAEVFRLRLVTDRRRGGVHMVQGCVRACEVAVEERLARGVVETQQSEGELTARMLRERKAVPRSR